MVFDALTVVHAPRTRLILQVVTEALNPFRRDLPERDFAVRLILFKVFQTGTPVAPITLVVLSLEAFLAHRLIIIKEERIFLEL